MCIWSRHSCDSIGANDLIIAASPGRILVADKASSPKIKDLINGFHRSPMVEKD
ncbi:hypothetical protein [Parageobacillus thermoglucosidasius]|uniref:hypothetical protein n=1 Tax=Parageobacillus thermoglucosidasius TaxID=1426 RepID=UPI000310B0BD|nr:hypothetical protein [Parageobacillus thermoglucosidasius]